MYAFLHRIEGKGLQIIPRSLWDELARDQASLIGSLTLFPSTPSDAGASCVLICWLMFVGWADVPSHQLQRNY
jgi:hypothetical protein